MGYTTKYIGILKFDYPVSIKDLKHIRKFLDIDIREHPEFEDNTFFRDLYYTVDLKLADDFSGLKWNGMEKSYQMVSQVNFVIEEMRKFNPEFKLKCGFLCQGEDFEDRWRLVVNDWAKKVEIPITGQIVTCPNCEQTFVLEDV